MKIQTPLTKEKIKNLKAGQTIYLSGTIYTGRDSAHKRLKELYDQGLDLPIDLEDQVIYYVGPTPSKPGEVFGSGGPTTSGRMDAYAPLFISLGMRAMIGKGYRNEEVKKAIQEHTGVYLGAIGGAGAIISSCVKSATVVAFEDLGPEAIRCLEIEDMPLVVLFDSDGNDQYEFGKNDYLNNKGK
ncbi:Fe-S-containing hydro-lyase [Tannockella kyphosi]